MNRSLCLSLLTLVLMLACSESSSGPSPMSLSVSPASAIIFVGDSLQMSAALLNTQGDTQSSATIAWASSVPSVLSVSSSGWAKGLASGPAAAVASAQGVTTVAPITVLDHVVSLVLTPDTVTMHVNDLYYFHADPRDSLSASIWGRIVEWTTLDSGIVSVTVLQNFVDSKVIGVAPGTARIVATSEGRADTSTVTILP